MPGRTQYGMPSNPWRDRWQQASFRGAIFYSEHDARSGGRRLAIHSYPKGGIYTEDMGHRVIRHPVTGYLIGPNYLGPRDDLINALETEGPGMLIHPLLGQMQVSCETYTVTETRERGGYCQFEMMFVEAGADAGSSPTASTQDAASGAAGHSSGGAISTLRTNLASVQ